MDALRIAEAYQPTGAQTMSRQTTPRRSSTSVELTYSEALNAVAKETYKIVGNPAKLAPAPPVEEFLDTLSDAQTKKILWVMKLVNVLKKKLKPNIQPTTAPVSGKKPPQMDADAYSVASIVFFFASPLRLRVICPRLSNPNPARQGTYGNEVTKEARIL